MRPPLRNPPSPTQGASSEVGFRVLASGTPGALTPLGPPALLPVGPWIRPPPLQWCVSPWGSPFSPHLHLALFFLVMLSFICERVSLLSLWLSTCYKSVSCHLIPLSGQSPSRGELRMTFQRSAHVSWGAVHPGLAACPRSSGSHLQGQTLDWPLRLPT